jgi:peptide/nickel transport system substrate-binding protein
MARKSLAEKGVSNANRRNVLKALGATGATMSVAGCMGGGDSEGDGGDSGGGGGGGGDNGSDSGGDQTSSPGEPVRTLDYVSLSESVHPIRFTWGQMHANQLRELGFDVEYHALSIPDYIDRGFNQRSHDIYILRYLDGFDPSGPLYTGFHSDSTQEGGGNCSLYQSDEFDEMYAQQSNAVDPDERQQIVYDIQEMLMDKQIISPVMVQNRQMPYDTQKVTNTTSMLEYGLGCIHNFQSMEPAEGNDSTQLTWSLSEDLTTLNPINPERGRAERQINRLVYDRLMRFSADTAEPIPWMAESVEQTDDTTVDVTLREGLQWHDGESVTAEDVRFTFTYGAEVSPNVAGVTESIDSIETDGDLNITFNLTEPTASFQATTLAGRSSQIIPQHVWEDVPESVGAETATDWTNPEPVGSGPFQVESFTLGEELELSRFDAYGEAGFDTPNFETSVRLQAPDIRTTVRQLEDGTVDFIPYEIQTTDVQRFQQNDRYGLADSLMTSIHYACYNMNRDLFADNEMGRAVRRAMAYAIPKQEAIQVATGGTAEEIQTCFSTGLSFWYNEDVESFNLDLEAARSELEAVGFSWNDDGRILMPA